jgi:hypothetical protein|tara:strand:+ start:2134 stop:2352 length:219 start_codon:yes stop_codon:yes gene_type:complete
MSKAINQGGGFTPEGRRAAAAELKARRDGWPSFIADPIEREEHVAKWMNGRRYDEPGMVVRFKLKAVGGPAW